MQIFYKASYTNYGKIMWEICTSKIKINLRGQKVITMAKKGEHNNNNNKNLKRSRHVLTAYTWHHLALGHLQLKTQGLPKEMFFY